MFLYHALFLLVLGSAAGHAITCIRDADTFRLMKRCAEPDNLEQQPTQPSTRTEELPLGATPPSNVSIVVSKIIPPDTTSLASTSTTPLVLPDALPQTHTTAQTSVYTPVENPEHPQRTQSESDLSRLDINSFGIGNLCLFSNYCTPYPNTFFEKQAIKSLPKSHSEPDLSRLDISNVGTESLCFLSTYGTPFSDHILFDKPFAQEDATFSPSKELSAENTRKISLQCTMPLNNNQSVTNASTRDDIRDIFTSHTPPQQHDSLSQRIAMLADHVYRYFDTRNFAAGTSCFMIAPDGNLLQFAVT